MLLPAPEQLGHFHRFDTTDFRESNVARHEHGIAQVIITEGGFNERLVFLAVTIPDNNHHRSFWKNEIWFNHVFNLPKKQIKSSVRIFDVSTLPTIFIKKVRNRNEIRLDK